MLLHLVCLSTVLTLGRGWIMEVDSYSEECVFEEVEEGTKLSLVFQVLDGGFLDIDVTILGPDRKEIYIGTRETEGKYTFSAYEGGKYQFCFSNQMSTVTPKSVKFDLSVGDVADWRHATDGQEEEEEEEAAKVSNTSAVLHAEVVELSRGMWGINGEQEYIIARMNMHRRISEHTNHIVVRWCLFEVMLITLGMCFEIWYITRFFEVRRMV